MDVKKKPECEFGAKCYRKNPKHLESYSHPNRKNNSSVKKVSREPNRRSNACGFQNSSEEQIIEEQMPRFQTVASKKSHKRKIICDKRGQNVEKSFKRKKKVISEGVTSNSSPTENKEKNSDFESVCSSFCNSTVNNSNEAISSSDIVDLKCKTPEEVIRTLFLVDMPSDFYSFYQFCKVLKENDNLEPLKFGDLKLVGPFDILSGKVKDSVNPNLFLCHWRFYYDPPEFQTVLANESGFHIGYWRDEPKENPVFIASNNANKDCVFQIEAENLFGAVYHYLNEFRKKGDPFSKVKTSKLQLALKNWAEKNNFTLEKKTSRIKSRQKKIVSKTFHGAGIVVPTEAKTELGYRPLIETDANLKNICNLIIKSNDENERETFWENLQPLITAANIANDECDFGNSLELGIDLFCMGSPIFHETVEHLLTTAYSLLNRTEFEKIIKAHLKFRRKDNNLSLCLK